MITLTAIINVLVMLAMSSPSSTPGEAVLLAERNAQLEAELKLSGQKSTYGVIDFSDNSVHVKARGVTLKRLPVLEIHDFGRWSGPGPFVVLGKKASSEPLREQVRPQGGGDDAGKPADTYDVKALEVSDMPSSYTMHLEGGLLLRVVSGGGRPRSLLARARGVCIRPYRVFVQVARSGGYSEVELMLNEEDARALYWHLGEGMSVFMVR